jgi:hypothetical protein
MANPLNYEPRGLLVERFSRRKCGLQRGEFSLSLTGSTSRLTGRVRLLRVRASTIELPFDDASVLAHLNLSVAMGAQGKHEKADEVCHEVIKRQPRNALAHWELSSPCVLVGDACGGRRRALNSISASALSQFFSMHR